MSRRLKFLAVMAVLSALALFAQQVHQSDPPAVFRAEAFPSIGHCYRLPSPGESKTYFCDVRSPATGKDYVVTIVDRGGVSVYK